MKKSLFTLFICLLVIRPSFAQETSGRDVYTVNPAAVELIMDIDVPARETGLLKEIAAEQNGAVASDQVVARIDDQVSQRMLEQATFKLQLAQRKATDSTEINAAEKKYALADSEFNTNQRLFKKGSKTRQEAMRSLYSKEIAALEITAARNARQLALIEEQTELVNVNAAKDSIARHQIKSPIDGHVLKRYKEPGEWVNAGEPILRIAPLDRLRIQGNVDGSLYNPHQVDGRPVTVILTRANKETVEFPGRIVVTMLEKRVGSNQFMVWAEVENRLEPGSDRHWILQPKSTVSMQIHLNGTVSSSSSTNAIGQNPIVPKTFK